MSWHINLLSLAFFNVLLLLLPTLLVLANSFVTIVDTNNHYHYQQQQQLQIIQREKVQLSSCADTVQQDARKHPGLSFRQLSGWLRGGVNVPSLSKVDENSPSNTSVYDKNETIERNGWETTVDGFTLLSETVLYEKWRRLTSRRVRLPNGLVTDFEIVGQSTPFVDDENDDDIYKGNADQAVLVFVWCTQNQTITMLREYMPSVHGKLYGLAAGMVEPHKHGIDKNNMSKENGITEDEISHMQLTAAQHELEEECRLVGGQWIRLTKTSVAMDKYSSTRLTVYLVIDPSPVSNSGKERDANEVGMDIVEGVTVHQLKQWILNGQLTAIGSWACLLAFDKLREMGERKFL